MGKPQYADLLADNVATVNIPYDTDRVGVYAFDATEPVYVTVDGSTPDVKTEGSYVVPPGVRRVIPVITAAGTVVKLRSAAVASVEVEPA